MYDWIVAQVTIYLPDAVLDKLKQRAKRSGKSLSALVLEIIEQRRAPAKKWPRGFAELYGSWRGSFPIPEDPPPDEVEPLG